MKRTVKRLLISLCAVTVTLILASCSFFGKSDTSSDDRNGGSSVAAKQSIQFLTAMENYEKAGVKRTDIALTVDGKVKCIQSGLEGDYGVGLLLDIRRIANGSMMYVESSAKPHAVEEKALSIIYNIPQSIGPGTDETSRKTNAFAKDVAKSVYDFLDGHSDFSFLLGEVESDYNLKAAYKNASTGEANGVWLCADEKSLGTWLNTVMDKSDENAVGDFFMKSVYSVIKKTEFSEDKSGKFVNKNGESEYDFKLRVRDNLAADLFDSLLETTGSAAKVKEVETYSSYISKIASYIDVRSVAITGTADSAGLPIQVKATSAIDFNAPTAELVKMFLDMEEEGLITEEQRIVINTIVNTIGKYVGGTNGEKDAIGISLNVSATEDFSFDAGKCNLTKKNQVDTDMFLKKTETAAERESIETYLKGFNAEEFIQAALDALGEEFDGKKIDMYAQIIKEMAGLDKVTKKKLQPIIDKVIEEFGKE